MNANIDPPGAGILTPAGGADLEDWEIDRICDGLVQSAAMVRYLRSLGLHVERKPNGRPLVNRAHYNEVRGKGAPATSDAASAGPVWGVH